MKRRNYIAAGFVALGLTAGAAGLNVAWKKHRLEQAWERLQIEETRRLQAEAETGREVARRRIAQVESEAR